MFEPRILTRKDARELKAKGVDLFGTLGLAIKGNAFEIPEATMSGILDHVYPLQKEELDAISLIECVKILTALFERTISAEEQKKTS